MTKIIADPGSCHLGNLNLAKELINIAAGCGADAIKFQLFKNSPGNIPLPYEWFPELVANGVDRGIEVFASVWDEEGVEVLKENGFRSIKLAYSQRGNLKLRSLAQPFLCPYMSGDIWTDFPNWAIRLYCIPEYPVQYKIDFEGLFDSKQPRFHGFSSHTLGIQQDLRAVKMGAGIIEKHIRLDDEDCEIVPDGKFALKSRDFYRLCKIAKDI